MPYRWFLRCANSNRHGKMFLAAVAICWLAALPCAHAADTCTGTYSASLIHPIQSHGVMLPDIRRPDLSDLRNRFLAGLHRGGIAASDQSTTRLGFVAIAIPAPNSVSRLPGSMRGLGWALDTEQSADSVMAATLLVSVNLTNTQTYEIGWVFTLECKIQTEDRGAVVERIGELVGRSAGKEVHPTRF